jgi:hypothetical protein
LVRADFFRSKLTDQGRYLVCFGIKREVSCVEDVDFRLRYILAIAFRFAEIEREIVLAPENQKLWLRLLEPCLPLRISIDVRAVVIEEIALNLRLPWRIQKCVLIGPKIRVIELDLRIVSDMAGLRGGKRSRFLRKASS